MAIELINIRVYDSSGAIDSSLSPSIMIYDNLDNSLDFSWTMSFNTTLKTYQFLPNVDTTKNYTCNIDFWVSALTRYASFWISASAIVWGATVADIWTAQIADYSAPVGSFANKFSNYWGVSHVIREVDSKPSKIDKEDMDKISKLISDMTELINKLWQPKEFTKEVVRIERIEVPSNDSKATAKVIVKWLKELNNTLSSIMVKGLIEIKNNK